MMISTMLYTNLLRSYTLWVQLVRIYAQILFVLDYSEKRSFRSFSPRKSARPTAPIETVSTKFICVVGKHARGNIIVPPGAWSGGPGLRGLGQGVLGRGAWAKRPGLGARSGGPGLGGLGRGAWAGGPGPRGLGQGA